MKLALILPMAGLLVATTACASQSPNSIQLAQERHSCAEMGIDPGSEAFGQCVANLDMTMFEANNTAAR
jgi:hypothetical protein